MVSFAADENFNQVIVRGMRRKLPGINILTVQEAGLSGSDDPTILRWAAELNRVLLTHDVSTMSRYAYDRVISGDRMPGVFEVGKHVMIKVAIEELLLIAECSLENEWEGQIRYLPLH